MPFDVNKRLPTEDQIKAAAEKAKVPFAAFKNLIYLESRGNPNAQSQADNKGRRAWGAGQLRGPAMQEMGLKWEDRLDPQKNLDAAAGYFAKKLKQANGDTTLAGLLYYKGDAQDAAHYRKGEYNLMDSEAQKRVSQMSGTGEKLPPNVLAQIPISNIEHNTAAPTVDTSASQRQDAISAGLAHTPSLFATLSSTDGQTTDTASTGGFMPSYQELPTSVEQYKTEHGGQAPDEKLDIPDSVGYGEIKGFYESGGYDIFNAKDPAYELQHRFKMMGNGVSEWLGAGSTTETQTPLSDATVARIKNEMDWRDYGLTEGRTDKEVNDYLDVYKQRRESQRIHLPADNLNTNVVGSSIGEMVGSTLSPQGIVATAAGMGVGKVISGVGGAAFRMFSRGAPTLAADGLEGMSAVAARQAPHPVVQALTSTAAGATKGSFEGATFGAVDELGRQSQGYYHTNDDLWNATVGGAQIGLMLGGGLPLAAKGVGYVSKKAFSSVASGLERRYGASRTTSDVNLDEPTQPQTGTGEAPQTASEAPTRAPEPQATQPQGQGATTSERAAQEASAAQMRPQEDIRSMNADTARRQAEVEPLRQQRDALQQEHVKASKTLNRYEKLTEKGKMSEKQTASHERIRNEHGVRAAELERLNGLIGEHDAAISANKEAVAKSSRGGEHYEAAKSISQSSRLAKLHKQIETLTGEHNALKETREAMAHEEVGTSKGAVSRQAKRLAAQDKKIAKHQERIDRASAERDSLRNNKGQVITRFSHVVPEMREVLKRELGMSDAEIDHITQGMAEDRMTKYHEHLEKGIASQSRVNQSIDATMNGVEDPSFSAEHEAGRDVYTDGQSVFTVEAGALDGMGKHPDSIPEAKMAEGNIHQGESPANPVNNNIYQQQEATINPVRNVSDEKPVGLLKKFDRWVGTTYLRYNDLSNVMRHSNIDALNTKADAYAIPTRGKVGTDGVHSMFREDGVPTMEDLGIMANRRFDKVAITVQNAERTLRKDFDWGKLSDDDFFDKMGLDVQQAIEDLDGELYKTLHPELKKVVDEVRAYNQAMNDWLTNVRQFNPNISEEQIKQFKSSIEPQNYFSRFVDKNLVGEWKRKSKEMFGVEHNEILHRNLVDGYNANTARGAKVRADWKDQLTRRVEEESKPYLKEQETHTRLEAKVRQGTYDVRVAEDQLSRTTDPKAIDALTKQLKDLKATLSSDTTRMNVSAGRVKLNAPKLEALQATIADDGAILRAYIEAAKEKAKNFNDLAEHDSDVMTGHNLDLDLDSVKPDSSTYEAHESAKMMKERFPMNTAHETVLTDRNGNTISYSFDKMLRENDLETGLKRYHRIATSELANRVVNGKSYAGEMMELDRLEKAVKSHERSGTLNRVDSKKALDAIEAMRRFQQVIRQNRRMQNSGKLDKVGKLTRNHAFRWAGWSFGPMNATEAGLTYHHHLNAMIARDFPFVFDLGLGKDVQMTKPMLNDLMADYLASEAHAQFSPRLSRVKDLNRDVWGEGPVNDIMSAWEARSDRKVQNSVSNRMNTALTNHFFKSGQMAGASFVMRDALSGKVKGAYRGEKYFGSWRVKPEEYEALLNKVRENVSLTRGEASFKDDKWWNTSREGHTFQKIMEMHGREGLQTMQPGATMFGGADGTITALERAGWLFKDFARRSVNRSLYFYGQGIHNGRGTEMFMGQFYNGVMSNLLYTMRTYITAYTAFSGQEREDFLNSRLNWGAFARNTLGTLPALGMLNTVRLPMQAIGYDPLANSRQTAGFLKDPGNIFDSKYNFQQNVGRGIVGMFPGYSVPVNAVSLGWDVAHALANGDNNYQRNQYLDKTLADFKGLTFGNPVPNFIGTQAVDYLKN